MFICEGAIFNNRFQFFKVSINTNTGKFVKEWYEKYNLRNEKRNNEYYIEGS